MPVIAPTQTILLDIIAQENLKKNAKIEVAFQEKALGTGHAVQCALPAISKLFSTNPTSNLKVIVAYGDTPAIEATTFSKLISQHLQEKNALTIVGFVPADPQGYGRILIDEQGQFLAIREQKDCSSAELLVKVCNSGFICADFPVLNALLPLLENSNAAAEFYLTDVPLLAKNRGFKVGLMVETEESQFLGINTQEQLKKMELIFQNKGVVCAES